jgi:hypothetical protein
MAILPVRQIRKIEVEPLFDGFVRSYGRRVLKEHISNVNPPSNADYYFDYPRTRLVAATPDTYDKSG